jgi:endonuclease YncB( thermonuclease family)
MFTWWLLWRVPVLLLAVMALWWFGFRPFAGEQGWVPVSERFALCGKGGARAASCVVDGDTVVIGGGRAQRRIRLTGFDAPELEGACLAERRLALEAQRALHTWLARGGFEWNGGADPPRDQYGRELRAARRSAPGGRRELLANHMITRGLAGESGWGSSPVNWCD